MFSFLCIIFAFIFPLISGEIIRFRHWLLKVFHQTVCGVRFASIWLVTGSDAACGFPISACSCELDQSSLLHHRQALCIVFCVSYFILGVNVPLYINMAIEEKVLSMVEIFSSEVKLRPLFQTVIRLLYLPLP